MRYSNFSSLGIWGPLFHTNGPTQHIWCPSSTPNGQINRIKFQDPTSLVESYNNDFTFDMDIHLRGDLHSIVKKTIQKGEEIVNATENQNRNDNVNPVHDCIRGC